MALTPEQIKNQSLSALRQWRNQWEKHAKYHSKYEMRSLEDFEGIGTGKACLLIANGATFEQEIDVIREHQKNVDIVVCDKTLGHCLDNGIVPTYCVVADANVSYARYLEKWKDKLQDTILFVNVCANPLWTDNGNWKDKHFFCVKDVIESEKIFGGLSNCKNQIAAATNVSNSMVVFMTQCDNDNRRNFFGYDKYLLIGFDYCWTQDMNYYSFDHDGGGKRYYMRHIYGRTIDGGYCYTSNNLAFSMQWLEQYVKAFGIPIVQCGSKSVFIPHGQKKPQRLIDHIQYKGTQSAGNLTELLKKRRDLLKIRAKMEEELKTIRAAQFYEFMASI